MMLAMSNPATIAGADSNSVLADSAPMTNGAMPASESNQPSPAPSATAPGTGRGEELPLPVPGEGRGEGLPREIGGREGLDPTRYGDWEKSGRCIDF